MKTAEISQLVSELFEMSKEYLVQETAAPARGAARRAGLSLLAGFMFAIGWLFLAVAVLRLAQDLLPDKPLWSVLAYVIAAVAAGGLATLVVWNAARARASR